MTVILDPVDFSDPSLTSEDVADFLDSVDASTTEGPISQSTDDIIVLSTGNQITDGLRGDDIIIGTDGDDFRLYGGADDDFIFGGDGDDFVGGSSGSDTVIGGRGDDTIRGGGFFESANPDSPGDDLLIGGDGNDQLFASNGVDTMIGGAGSDTFVFEADVREKNGKLFNALEGVDQIVDFQQGTDSIVIRGAGDGSTVSYDSNTGLLFLNNKAIAQLQPGLNLATEQFGPNDENFELF